ncbi:centromere protein I-like isoform X2 [Xenia sp. Carnegie-2017]|uniref:centromere protein I-like isoform X2 n=1 Tax=Xenia sp. Carnegie-2017 TaxID=2897299 RepID=UPI001F0392F7|nr:centromere protein I-like isoform X2 [Xenia sp. Carnegie-2017]
MIINLWREREKMAEDGKKIGVDQNELELEHEGHRISIDKLINTLENEEAIRRKPPALYNGTSVIVCLQEEACHNGLSDEQITRLLNICCSKKFVDAVRNQIIKCLIPRHGISADCIINVFSRMSANIINTSIQVSLLKWIIMVYELIDDRDKVHNLYGMIFHFLDNDTLCPYVCHLLYLMTRKDDVKAFRLRKLLDLMGKVGQQSYLIGLLYLYKIYSPHLVSVNIPNIKKAFFKRKDAKWLDILWKVNSAYQGNKTGEARLMKQENKMFILQETKRRRKDHFLHSSHSYYTNVHDGEMNTKVTMDKITCFDDFLSNIDYIEYPNQMGCIFESQYLQLYLTITQDEAAIVRLNFWLQQVLYEELVSAPSAVIRERVRKLLQAILNFLMVYQKPLSSLELCLSQYLVAWNGADYQTLIFLLISQMPMTPYEKLNDLVLEPLRNLFFCSAVEFKCQVLSCFTEMLITYARSAMIISLEEKNKSMRASYEQMSLDKEEICTVMMNLVKFVDKISTMAMQMESDNILLQHCILYFFEQVSTLHHRFPGVNFVYTPSPTIVYRFIFSTNPMTISRLCNVMYKRYI